MVRPLSILLLCSVLGLVSCSDILREFKEDPTIVGGTFTGIKLSLTPVPGLPIPMPEVIIGRGTFYRIGGDRTVEVMAGDTTALATDPSSSGQLVGQAAKSEASMVIRAGEVKVKAPTRSMP
jgi:hypothetical protein